MRLFKFNYMLLWLKFNLKSSFKENYRKSLHVYTFMQTLCHKGSRKLIRRKGVIDRLFSISETLRFCA